MYLKQLLRTFFCKEKIVIIFGVFILLNISLFVVYHQSIYSYNGYADAYPNAGLEFFYYIHSIGLNPYHFICMMLLLPNIVSCDFLTEHITHANYPIETRISKKEYFYHMYFINILLTFVIVLILELFILIIIHFFYLPIQCNTMTYPDLYYATTQLLFDNELYNLIAFLLITPLGYSAVSALLFSFQRFINNPFVYRCSGVLIGILLVLLPVLIQVYLPIKDAALFLQINNLVCLGIEGVIENPFQLDYWMVYMISLIIYEVLAWLCFQYLYRWRFHND